MTTSTHQPVPRWAWIGLAVFAAVAVVQVGVFFRLPTLFWIGFALGVAVGALGVAFVLLSDDY